MHSAEKIKKRKTTLYNFSVVKYNAVIQTKHASQDAQGKGEKSYEKDDRYDVGTVAVSHLFRRLWC